MWRLSSEDPRHLLAHDFRFGIKSNKAHPMRELPNALLALQQKRKRAAAVADGVTEATAGENRRQFGFDSEEAEGQYLITST